MSGYLLFLAYVIYLLLQFKKKKSIHILQKNNVFAVCLSFHLIFFFNWMLLKYLMRCLHYGICDSKFLASSDTVYIALPGNL